MDDLCGQQPDSCATYAVVDKKKKKKTRNDKPEQKESISDLYAVVDKKKSKDTSQHQGEHKEYNDVTALYAVVDKTDKRQIPLMEKKAYTSEKYQQHYEEEDTFQPTHSNSQRGSVNVLDNYKSSDSCRSEKPNSKMKMTLMPHLGWFIIVIILLLFLIAFIICTAVGFYRLSTNNSVMSIQQPVTTFCNSSFNESITPTSITTDNSDVYNPVYALLANTSYSSLIDFFHNKTSLFGLVKDCANGKQFILEQCILSLFSVYGKNNLMPALSCKELYQLGQSSSDYYWVTASNGSIFQVYCDMTTACDSITGGLTRIVSIDSDTRSQYCVGDISLDNNNGCFRESVMSGCSGIIIPTYNISYSHICGTVDGGHFGNVDGFSGPSRSSTTTVSDNYVDGISLTYGNTSHKTHIWTFSAVRMGDCATDAPDFVETHYSCLKHHRSTIPLFFQRDFPYALNENFEIRLCQDEDRMAPTTEGIYLKSLQIFVY